MSKVMTPEQLVDSEMIADPKAVLLSDRFNQAHTAERKWRRRRVMSEFRNKLEKLINSESIENSSDTPDFILAEYLVNCLAAFDKATNTRTNWYLLKEEDSGQ